LIGRAEILYTQEIYSYFLPEVEFYFCSIIYYLTISLLIEISDILMTFQITHILEL